MPQDSRKDLPEPLQDANAPEVLKERCEYIYRRILPAVGATAVLSLLLSAFLWPSRPTELILFWQTAILLIAAAFWALALAYQRSGDAREHPQPWVRRAALDRKSTRLNSSHSQISYAVF